MRRAKGEIPEMARAGGETDVPPGWSLKKTGCNSSDVVALVRAVKAALAEGLSDAEAWATAKETAGAGIEDRGLEAWRAEVMRRAGRGDEPVPAPAPEPERRIAAPEMPRDVRAQLDVALAALVAGRSDLAMQVLRELGAISTRAPDGWAEALVARPARIPAPAPQAPADEAIEVAAPEAPRPKRATRAPARRARRSA